jgi:hypothetical protein
MEKLNDNDVDQLCRAAAIFLYYFKTNITTNYFSPIEVAERVRGVVPDVPHDDYFELAFKYKNACISALSSDVITFRVEQHPDHYISLGSPRLRFGRRGFGVKFDAFRTKPLSSFEE